MARAIRFASFGIATLGYFTAGENEKVCII